MTIYPLYEGSFSVDASKKFIPFDPLVHDKKDRPASLFIHVSPFLINTSKGLVVIDCGLGERMPNGELQIHENIRNLSHDPLDVKYVLMSHLHYDHAAGMMYEQDGKWLPTFPNADYYLQQAEIEYALARPGKSYHIAQIEALRRTSNLVILDGDGELDGFVKYHITGAHCQFHQVFWVNDGNEIAFFGGDVLPEPEQLIRNFVAKYDLDGNLAKQLRQQYGEQAAIENWTCLFYHAKNKSVSKVSWNGESFGFM